MSYMPQYVKDQRKALVEEIINDMQKGKVFMWDKGFTSSQAINAVTKSPYRGGNIIRLGYSAYKNGFKDRRWKKVIKSKKDQKAHLLSILILRSLFQNRWLLKPKTVKK